MSDSYVGLKKHCCFIHSIQKACRHSLLSSALPTEVLLRLRTCLEYRRKFALLGNSDSKVRQQFLSMLQIPQNMKDSGFSSSWFWKKSLMSVTLWTWSTSFPPSSQSDRKFLHGSFFRVWGGWFFGWLVLFQVFCWFLWGILGVWFGFLWVVFFFKF